MSVIIRLRDKCEERYAWRHSDRYDEDILEVSSDIKLPQNSSILPLKFLLTGDQDVGKTTLLNILANIGNINAKNHIPYLQLSSILPILSSTFTNSRYLKVSESPESIQRKKITVQSQSSFDNDFNLEEFEFLNTDIAQVSILIDIHDFNNFLEEFKIDFDLFAMYVKLHLTEIGGDHLDRFYQYKLLNNEVYTQTETILKDTQNIIYFINVEKVFEYKGNEHCYEAGITQFLERLRAIEYPSNNVYIYLSKIPCNEHIKHETLRECFINALIHVFGKDYINENQVRDTFNVLYQDGCSLHSNQITEHIPINALENDFSQSALKAYIKQMENADNNIYVKLVRTICCCLFGCNQHKILNSKLKVVYVLQPFPNKLTLIGVIVFLYHLIKFAPLSEAKTEETLVKSALTALLVYLKIKEDKQEYYLINENELNDTLNEIHTKRSFMHYDINCISNLLPEHLSLLWDVIVDLIQKYSVFITEDNELDYVEYPVKLLFDDKLIEHKLPRGNYALIYTSKPLLGNFCEIIDSILKKHLYLTKELFHSQLEVLWVQENTAKLVESAMVEKYFEYVSEPSKNNQLELMNCALDVYLFHKIFFGNFETYTVQNILTLKREDKTLILKKV